MNGAVDLGTIGQGFASPATDSQKAFRAILDAMSRPGRIYGAGQGLAAQPALHPATAAAALTLLDFETALWTDLPDDSPEQGWLKFHCGVPFAKSPGEADFAIITTPAEIPKLESFRPGTEREPHLSATLIIQVEALVGGDGKSFSGPGIEKIHRLDPRGIADHFWESRKLATQMFPLGVDVLFTCNDKIAAMPRTTGWDDKCM